MALALVGGVLINPLAWSAPADGKGGDGPGANQPARNTPAIEVWVDLALGVCDGKAAGKRLEALNIKNLKSALEAEMKSLKGDLFGVRQVSGKEFAAMMKQLETVSSFKSSKLIGKTGDRAYLEVRVHLTSQHSYVAIVTTELNGLPAEIRKKFE